MKIFESELLQIRVVFVKFLKEVVSEEKSKDLLGELKDEIAEKKLKIRTEGLQGPTLKKAHENVKIFEETEKGKIKEYENPRFWKMFELEGILSCCSQKTD